MLSCMPTYSIPKKKAELKVQKLTSGSREFQQLYRNFYDSIFSMKSYSKFYFVNDVYEIHSPDIETRYNRQRKAWKENNYVEEMTTDTFGYLNVDNITITKVADILKGGIEAGNLNESVLCDPSLGVQLSKHADVTSDQKLRDSARTLLVFKFMKGRVKTVDEQMEHLSEMRREPQLGFDTFSSTLAPYETASMFLSKMYYIYHFESELDVTPTSRPPQICPIAFINFRHSHNQNVAASFATSFNIEALLKYLKTGKLPLLLDPTPDFTLNLVTTGKVSRENISRKPHQRPKAATLVANQVIPVDPISNAKETKRVEELYEPTDDVRLRPSFLSLDKESGKWKELSEIFMSDVSRDGHFFTITEMWYIVSSKLSDKYEATRKQWASQGYSQGDLADCHGYLDVSDYTVKQLGEICTGGLMVGNRKDSALADPKQGVQLSQCPDGFKGFAEMAYEKVIMMFRYMPGRQAEMSETENYYSLRPPDNRYNSLVSERRNLVHSGPLSRLVYLHLYLDADRVSSTPPHICPVTFLRIKFRKGLKFKIKPVAGPDIQLLKECMRATSSDKHAKVTALNSDVHGTTTAKQRLRMALSGSRVSAPTKSTDEPHTSSSDNVPSGSGSSLNLYTPDSLKSSQYKRTNQYSQPQSFTSQTPGKVTASHLSAPTQSATTKNSISVVSTPANNSQCLTLPTSEKESVTTEKEKSAKSYLPNFKINFKNLFQRAVVKPTDLPMADNSKISEEQTAVNTSAVAEEIREMSAPTTNYSPSYDASTQSESDSPLAAEVTSKESRGESLVTEDSSSDSSDDSIRRTPNLTYHRGVLLSSDSHTESDNDAPSMPPRRRSLRVIESDESEVEELHQKKRSLKLFSKRRRTPAHGPILKECEGANDSNGTKNQSVESKLLDPALPTVSSPDADVTESKHELPYLHPMLPDCVVFIERLKFSSRQPNSVIPSSALFQFGPIDFKEAVGASDAEAKLPAEGDMTQNATKNEDIVSSAVKSLEGVKKSSETISQTIKRRMKEVPIGNDPKKSKDVEVKSHDTVPAVKRKISGSHAVSGHLSKESKDSKESESKDLKELKDSRELKESNDKHPVITHTQLTKKASNDSRKSTAVYEEVDIFASMRNQPQPGKRKKKRVSANKDTAKKSSLTAVPTVGGDLQSDTREVIKKSVHFRLELNTLHVWEIEANAAVSSWKHAKQENVSKEALPMKQRTQSKESSSVFKINTALPTPMSIIDGEKLQPVVDSSKGYIRLPELPMFHEKPKNDSLPGTVPKEPDQVGYVPVDQVGGGAVPMPEALLRPPSYLLNTPSVERREKLEVTDVIPGVNTPHSPSPVEEKSDSETEDLDVDDMLEKAEVVKNKDVSSKPSTLKTFPNLLSVVTGITGTIKSPYYPKQLGGELTKLCDNIRKLESPNTELDAESPFLPQSQIECFPFEETSQRVQADAAMTADIELDPQSKLTASSSPCAVAGDSVSLHSLSKDDRRERDSSESDDDCSNLLARSNLTPIRTYSQKSSQQMLETATSEDSEKHDVHINAIPLPVEPLSIVKPSQYLAPPVNPFTTLKIPIISNVHSNVLEKSSDNAAQLDSAYPWTSVSKPSVSHCIAVDANLNKFDKRSDGEKNTIPAHTQMSADKATESPVSDHSLDSPRLQIDIDSPQKMKSSEMQQNLTSNSDTVTEKTEKCINQSSKLTNTSGIQKLNKAINSLNFSLLPSSLVHSPVQKTLSKEFSGDINLPKDIKAELMDSSSGEQRNQFCDDSTVEVESSTANTGTIMAVAKERNGIIDTENVNIASEGAVNNESGNGVSQPIEKILTPDSAIKFNSEPELIETPTTPTTINKDDLLSDALQPTLLVARNDQEESTNLTAMNNCVSNSSNEKQSTSNPSPEPHFADVQDRTTDAQLEPSIVSKVPSGISGGNTDLKSAESCTTESAILTIGSPMAININTSFKNLKSKGRKLPRSLVMGPSQQIDSESTLQVMAKKRVLSLEEEEFGSKRVKPSTLCERNPQISSNRVRGGDVEMEMNLCTKNRWLSDKVMVCSGTQPQTIQKQMHGKSAKELDSIRWRNKLEQMSEQHLVSVEKCVNFLFSLEVFDAIVDNPQGYMDAFLNSQEEQIRVNNLSKPLFHNTYVRGCTSLADISLTFDNDGEESVEKSDSIFWETCPMATHACTCISWTMAKELLARDDSSPCQGFDDQDEIDTVRLAIAYSNQPSEPYSSCAEHIVSLEMSPSLLKHISREVVDSIDTGLLSMSAKTAIAS